MSEYVKGTLIGMTAFAFVFVLLSERVASVIGMPFVYFFILGFICPIMLVTGFTIIEVFEESRKVVKRNEA